MRVKTWRMRAARASIVALLAAAGVTWITFGATTGHAAGAKRAPAHASVAKKTIFVFAYFPHAIVPGTQAWYNGWLQAAAKLKAKFNVVVKEEASLDTDPASFLNFIKTGMVERPDGVIVVPNAGGSMAPGLRQLAAQYPDVKWLAMDQPVPDWGTSFVGTNNVAAGERDGKFLVSEYRQHKLPSNQVAVFSAPPGTSSQDERVDGFKAAIKGSPLKIVDTVQTADSTTGTSLTNMADVLTAHPDLGAVFSTANFYSSGVADELVRAHKLNIINVSVGPDTLSLQQIIGHKGFTAEVEQSYEPTGELAVTTLADSLAGKQVPKTIYVPSTFVTAGNARSYLKQFSKQSKS